MKKILLGILSGLFALPAILSAAYQYGSYNEYISHDSGSIYLKQDAELTFEFSPSSHNNQSISKNWDTLTVVATSAEGQTTFNTVELTGNTVNVGQYNTGDQLKLYLTNKHNVTSGAAWFGVSGWNPATQYNEYLLLNVHYNPNYRYDLYAFKVSGEDVNLPTGQPLPGAFAALLIGGGVAGGYGLKRRIKKRNA